MKLYSTLVITPIQHIPNVLNNLKKISKVKILKDPRKLDLKKIINKYDIIFTNPNKSKVFLGKDLLSLSKKLKIICTASTGTNHIDLKYCDENNIKIISLRNEKKIIKKISSTAELAFLLSLLMLRNIPEANKSVFRGEWDYEKFIGRQLNEVTIGVIGYGRLGKIITKYFKTFGSKIIIYDPYLNINDNKIKQTNNIQDLLKTADIITIHIHADKKNTNFIDSNKLIQMKKNVIIINTSRGEVIDEKALVQFLKKNKLAKIATDVLLNEQTNRNKSLLLKYSFKSNQVFITPHIGGMTNKAQEIAYNHIVNLLANEICI
tara:strand:+ start:11878 stop:12837 length:960 start_codon:yes stop_codon:yes gene_type:complete